MFYKPHAILIFFVAINNCFLSSRCIYNQTVSEKKFETNPAKWTEEGVWGPLLEDWALRGNNREKRVMQLPPSPGAYIKESTDSDYSEPESKISTTKPTKIVNNSQPPKQPPRQVSETDLYLLNAIEKLVYRTDFMEKRLRRVEEMLYYVMAGNRIDQDPCPENFTRAGANCYLFSSQAGREADWKVASKHCARYGAVLTELESIEENQDVISFIQTNDMLRGKDFWLGALNPGLLFIWSNSARPVSAPGSQNNKKKQILGDGRCLRLAYDHSLRSYNYKGTDCSIRYNYICEVAEKSSSNEISRIGRAKRIFTDEL